MSEVQPSAVNRNCLACAFPFWGQRTPAEQEQLFAVVDMGSSSLLTVDMDVEVDMPGVPAMMIKKVVNDALEHLANNVKKRAEQLA